MITSDPVLTLGLAFAFFVVALLVFLAAIYMFRLSRPVDSRSPMEQLVHWLQDNEVQYGCRTVEFHDTDEGVEVVNYACRLPVDGDTDMVFEFSDDGWRLVWYGLDDGDPAYSLFGRN